MSNGEELGEIRSAWGILARGAPTAARTLVAMSGGARSEFVRVQASTAILDRVGLGSVEGVVVDVGQLDGSQDRVLEAGRETAAAVLAARMAALHGVPAHMVAVEAVEPEE